MSKAYKVKAYFKCGKVLIIARSSDDNMKLMWIFLNNYKDEICVIMRCENELQLIHIRVRTVCTTYSVDEISL